MNENDPRLLARRIYKMLPPKFSAQQLEAAYEMGLLRKHDLEDGQFYQGSCRNAEVARWDAARQRFVYHRTKFGSSFNEDIVHPEDDEGYDVFAVIAKVDPPDASFDSQSPANRGVRA